MMALTVDETLTYCRLIFPNLSWEYREGFYLGVVEDESEDCATLAIGPGICTADVCIGQQTWRFQDKSVLTALQGLRNKITLQMKPFLR